MFVYFAGDLVYIFICCSGLSKRIICNITNNKKVLQQNKGPTNNVLFVSLVSFVCFLRSQLCCICFIMQSQLCCIIQITLFLCFDEYVLVNSLLYFQFQVPKTCISFCYYNHHKLNFHYFQDKLDNSLIW